MNEEFIDKLSAAAKDAREVLGELRSELREVRKQRKALAEEREAAEAMVRRAIEEEIRKILSEEVGKISPKVEEICGELYERISGECDKLLNLTMFGNEQGRGVNVLDEVRAKLLEARRIL